MRAATTSANVRNTHQLGDLTSRDRHGRTGHEGANGRQRDELDNPSQPSQTEESDDGAGDDSQGGRDQVGRDVREILTGALDDVAGDLRHDGDGLQTLAVVSQSWLFASEKYANGNILGSREEPVDEDTHEG